MTTVVTNATGGTAQPMRTVYIPPDRQMSADEAPPALVETGLDAAFVADLFSACLAHERCGVHLYRSVATRTSDGELQAQYEHFGKETRDHVDRLEQLIAVAGGDPQYVSGAARATERAGAALLESTFLLDGSIDVITAEVVMLETVMLAESKDHANWELLAQMASVMAAGDVQQQLAAAVDEVLAQEEKHYTWATEMRARLLLRLAGAVPTDADVADDASGSEVDELTRDDLYARAQELNIPGRSQMTKDELRTAVTEQEGMAS
jgi:rubrerythrin